MAHINVEHCGSILAVKYLFKYIYKGGDRTNVLGSFALTTILIINISFTCALLRSHIFVIYAFVCIFTRSPFSCKLIHNNITYGMLKFILVINNKHCGSLLCVQGTNALVSVHRGKHNIISIILFVCMNTIGDEIAKYLDNRYIGANEAPGYVIYFSSQLIDNIHQYLFMYV